MFVSEQVPLNKYKNRQLEKRKAIDYLLKVALKVNVENIFSCARSEIRIKLRNQLNNFTQHARPI